MSTDADNSEMTDNSGTDAGGESESSGNSTYQREPARRAFAAELTDATHIFKEGDKERDPKYALLPTGEDMNRCFFVGTLLNISHVGDNGSMVRARLVDNSGSPDEDGGGRMYAYAGQYSPGPAATLEGIEPPEYVALVAKPDTFETDEGNVRFSLRPESVNVVSESERNNWITDTARSTLNRIEQFENGETDYAQRAADEYGTDITPYRNAVQRALGSLKDD